MVSQFTMVHRLQKNNFLLSRLQWKRKSFSEGIIVLKMFFEAVTVALASGVMPDGGTTRIHVLLEVVIITIMCVRCYLK